MLNRIVCSTVLLISSHFFVNAQQSNNIQENAALNIVEFIETSYTPTYDCPTAALNSRIDEKLTLTNLTEHETLQLTSMKTHGLICAGKTEDAEILLQRLLADENADRSARYYLSAVFQYGFIYDLKENPERCDYYMLARDSSKNKFVDVHLSASLGFITECIINDVNKQVFGLSQLLESTTKMDDNAALAHAYNRMGLFYSNRKQNRLAAAQYLKAYETGKDIYTLDNSLSILGGAMTALTASGDMVAVKDVLDKFVNIYAKLNTKTPRTEFLQYYYQARYYSVVKEYDNLALSVNNWEKVASNSQNPVYQGLFRRYKAELCLHHNDVECLRDFIQSENNAPSSYLDYITRSKYYLRFLVEVNIFLGDKEGSDKAFANYEKMIKLHIRMLEDNTASLDIVGLHDKILNLETTIRQQENKRKKVAWFMLSALFVILLVVLWVVRRRYIKSKSFDEVTGVLNKTAVLEKLGQLHKPSAKCTNALAVFDITNFTKVNEILGSTKSDIILLQIVNTLKNITRNTDLLGRLGKEQFIICLVDIDENAAQAFFERAKEALALTFADQNNINEISVDSSMSIFYSTETFSDIDEILQNMLLSLRMKSENE